MNQKLLLSFYIFFIDESMMALWLCIVKPHHSTN